MFHKMIKFYQKPKHDDLNSRTIRESAFNMTACNFRIDGMCDQFIDYILENWEHVTGDTIEKVCSGYEEIVPRSAEKNLQ